MAPRLGGAAAACRWAWLRALPALRLALVLLNNLTVIPSYCLWLLLLRPLRLLGGEGGSALYWRAEGLMYGWMQAVMASWGWSAGYTVAEWGDDLSAICGGGGGGGGGGAMVLVNHQATGDIPALLTALLAKQGAVVRRTTWLMDHVFRLSNFGVVSALHGDFFIRQGREHRGAQLAALARHLEARRQHYRHDGDDGWIVLFPEGGFLRNRRVASQQFARENGLPHLTHVTLPRQGAAQVILRTLRAGQDPPSSPSSPSVGGQEGLRWVVDVTMAYPPGGARPMDIQTWVLGHRPPTVIHVHYRTFAACHVPVEAEPLTAWLYQRFVEKDRLLAHFYHTGAFPPPAVEGREETVTLDWGPRPVTLDSGWLLGVHLLALASGAMWYQVLRYLCGCVFRAVLSVN